MINKSATKAATIRFANGNSEVLWLGHNRNTGESIVWLVTWRKESPGKSRRVTGCNIKALAAEIATIAPSEGEIEIHSAESYAAILT